MKKGGYLNFQSLQNIIQNLDLSLSFFMEAFYGYLYTYTWILVHLYLDTCTILTVGIIGEKIKVLLLIVWRKKVWLRSAAMDPSLFCTTDIKG